MEQLSLPEKKCPSCIDEVLARALGNILVCQDCERVFVEETNVNTWLEGPVYLLPKEEL